MASSMSLRIDDDLREKFIEAARDNGQSQSEAMRDAVAFYVRRAKDKRVREAAARIRANVEEEEEVMQWIAEYGVALHDDD